MIIVPMRKLSLALLFMVVFRGVTDVGTGLQAVAAAITDPDTISAFQSETRDGNMSHRTFYGGMHELSGGLDDAASGIHELAKVLLSPLATHINVSGAVDGNNGPQFLRRLMVHLRRTFLLTLQAVHHVGDGFESISKSFDNLAASVVALKGAIQVSVRLCLI